MEIGNAKGCPVCRNTHVSRWSNQRYLVCANCHMVWAKEMPVSDYTTTYYQGQADLVSRLFSPVTTFFYWLRRNYVGLKRKELWIDVGAGDGSFLKSVNAKGKVAVEISSTGRRLIKEKGINVLTPQQFQDSKNINADVISFWHVLEHVDDPKALLLAANKNLAKRGQVIIGVPNIDSYEFEMFKEKWFHFAPRYHRWHFSLRGLKVLLAKGGFKIEKIDYWSPEHQLAGLIQSFINLTTSSDNALHKIVKRREKDADLSFWDLLAIIFWLTFGLPIIFGFWIFAVKKQKPGTIVVVARLRPQRSLSQQDTAG